MYHAGIESSWDRKTTGYLFLYLAGRGPSWDRETSFCCRLPHTSKGLYRVKKWMNIKAYMCKEYFNLKVQIVRKILLDLKVKYISSELCLLIWWTNHSYVTVYALYCALISSEGVRYSLVFNGYYRENYEKQYFASTLYQIKVYSTVLHI